MKAIPVLLASMTALLLTTAPSLAQEPVQITVQQRSGVQQDWNTEVYPFDDTNKNYVLDGGEVFVSAQGAIAHDNIEHTWVADGASAHLYVPYGVAFHIYGDALEAPYYDCPIMYGTMPDSNIAYMEYPCWRKPWNEIIHIWIVNILR